MNLMQRLVLLAAFLGCFAFIFAWAAGRAAHAVTAEPGEIAPLEFYQIGESKFLVLRAEQPLTDAEMDSLRAKLNTNPVITHELAR